MTAELQVRCWAQSLGDCGGELGSAPFVSPTLFDAEQVIVSGLPWCKEGNAVSVIDLPQRDLCVAHHARLQETDVEVAKLKHALSRTRGALHEKNKVKIKRSLLERWLLKSAINLLAHRTPASFPRDIDYAALAFGTQAFPVHMQVQSVIGVGTSSEHAFRCQLLMNEATAQPVLFVAWLHGIQFHLPLSMELGLDAVTPLQGFALGRSRFDFV